uniref:Uncharacterized protein n=1 Tax=Arundo donax TaxID=35708 RepID=A0A0A8ZXG3_ARUDO
MPLKPSRVPRRVLRRSLSLKTPLSVLYLEPLSVSLPLRLCILV